MTILKTKSLLVKDQIFQDDFDRIYIMGFNESVNKIAIHLPLKYQKVLFEGHILTVGFKHPIVNKYFFR